MELRVVPGFKDYQVTSDGQVFNFRGMRLRSYDANGYRRISLKKDDGKRVGIDIHRLVALAWLGGIPAGYWVNHENGDKSDNRVENLRVDTPSYNHRHAIDVLGRRPGNEKLEQKEAMKLLSASGWSQHKISRAFNCSQPNVREILLK